MISVCRYASPKGVSCTSSASGPWPVGGCLPGPAWGAGEPTIGAMGGAIGNAVFAATGKRVRQLPMTPERVKAVPVA